MRFTQDQVKAKLQKAMFDYDNQHKLETARRLDEEHNYGWKDGFKAGTWLTGIILLLIFGFIMKLDWIVNYVCSW